MACRLGLAWLLVAGISSISTMLRGLGFGIVIGGLGFGHRGRARLLVRLAQPVSVGFPRLIFKGHGWIESLVGQAKLLMFQSEIIY